MATIEPYTTKAGRRYRVRYRTPDRRQTDKRGFKTKREAEAFAASVEVAKLSGEYVAHAAGRLTVDDAARAWLSGKVGLSGSTRARYDSIIRSHISPALGSVPVGDLTPERLRAWVTEQAGNLAAGTVHKNVTVLRQMLAQAVTDRRLAVNPAADLDLPKVEHAEIRFLTPQQVAALAAEAGDNGPLVYTLAYCGLRLGEAFALRDGDVDFSRGRLRVHRSVTLVEGRMVESSTKANKGRDVPLPGFVGELLRPRVGGEPVGALVFPNSRGGFQRGNNMRRRWWADAVVRSGAPAGFHPHELRHTYASLAISSGVPIKALQAAMGHQSAALTLDRYGHLYETDYSQIADRMDALHHAPLRAVN